MRAESKRDNYIKNSIKFTVTCNLLMSTLERVTDKGETGRILKEDSTAVTFKCLPAIVKGKIDQMAKLSVRLVTRLEIEWTVLSRYGYWYLSSKKMCGENVADTKNKSVINSPNISIWFIKYKETI